MIILAGSPLVPPAIVLLVLVLCGSAGGQEKPDLTFPQDRVLAILKESLAKIKSLKVSCRSYHRQNLGTDDCNHVIIAAKDQSRYQLLWHGEAGSLENDPGAFERFCDGECWNIFSIYFRRYEVSKRFAAPPWTNKIRAHPVFENLGWWPPGDQSEPVRLFGKRRYFISDVLEDGRCRVLPKQELVDGTWCHVIEVPGLNRLFVDCRRGVVLRHEIFKTSNASERLVTLEMSDFRLVDDDIWLPYRLRRIVHARSTDIVTIVDRYELNNVQDELFNIDPPPGTMVYDRDTDTFYQIPGGLEILDRLEAWVRAATQSAEDKQKSAGDWWAFLGAFGLGVVGYWGIRFSGRRRDRLKKATRT